MKTPKHELTLSSFKLVLISESNPCDEQTRNSNKFRGVVCMKNVYKLIMNSSRNPLSNIGDVNTRHLVMQILAWMWCIIFSMSVGSIFVFQISAIAHALIIAGVFITFGAFETAKKRPQYFGGLGRGGGGEHN